MFSSRHALDWLSTWLIVASVATATITPSNTSTTGSNTGFQGTLPLRQADGNQIPLADVVPLTREAAQRCSIEGNLFNTNFSSVANIASGQIAYISCNPSDYTGFADADKVFETALKSANISAVLLYSTATDYCNYTQSGAQDMMQSFPVLSMTKKAASAALLNSVTNLAVGSTYSIKVQGRGDDNNSSGNNNNNNQTQNPLGPSPSTAVAMIILYSITGIITALFLVIIITGAIRAHRHPERYGPRDVLGRPRQSRARGLGRAILDTIPIVKFGEKEPAKPADEELASVNNTRDISSTNEAGQETNQSTTNAGETPTATGDTTEQNQAAASGANEHQEGIAPAQSAAAMSISKDSSSHDENLGCSICTEDFEKGQDLRVLPCNHKFHPECVDPWLLNVSGTCPLCRVDLRPVPSHDSSSPSQTDALTPPLHPDAEHASHRRRTAFRDILSLRARPNATPEERIHALRRFREQRHRRDEDTAHEGAQGADDGGETRMSRRLSRFSGVFTGRWRERSPALQQQQEQSGESGESGESSSSAATQQAQAQLQRDTSPRRTTSAHGAS